MVRWSDGPMVHLLAAMLIVFLSLGKANSWETIVANEFGTQESKGDFDFAGGALQIKTDIKLGSYGKIELTFSDDNNKAVYMVILFGKTIQYRFGACTPAMNDFTNLPSEDEKVWTIAKTDEPRITMNCNGIEVLDFLMSDDTCTQTPKWAALWSLKVTRISYWSVTNSVDGYRKEVMCSMPVITNAAVIPDHDKISFMEHYSVSCDEGYTISGSDRVTCQEDGQLTELPICKQDEEDAHNEDEGNMWHYSHAFYHKASGIVLASFMFVLNFTI